MEDTDIFIFGDSITYGAWDKEKGGWVNRLRLYLENDCIDTYYNIFNLGISGETTDGILKRFHYECNARFNKDNRTIIIFSVGINDTQDINGKDRVSIFSFRENLIALIKEAKKYSNCILFLGLTNVDESKVVPLPWNREKSYFNKKIIDFDKEIEHVCLEHQVNYLNIFHLLKLEELSDGLHPNEVGHQKLCDVVKKYILESYFD